MPNVWRAPAHSPGTSGIGGCPHTHWHRDCVLHQRPWSTQLDLVTVAWRLVLKTCPEALLHTRPVSGVQDSGCCFSSPWGDV